ncbi:MAG: PKD domain-containing protein, partial [Bacteroidia bacterium]|nr:PKD domain-containing protein [Bacteroidia bacterium]
YIWSINDSAFLSFNAVYNFEHPGSYQIYLVAVDSLGNIIDMDIQYISVNGIFFNIFPDFYACPGDKVTFQAVGDLYWLEWDLGNGHYNDENWNISQVYNQEGEYNVILTGESSCGIDTIEQTLFITNSAVPPVEASVGYSNDYNCAGDEIYFQSRYNAYSYVWNFDDGGISAEQDPMHIFNTNGTKVVTLTVTNICGNSATDSIIIYIKPDVEATANFVVWPEPACPGEVVAFNAFGTGDFIWDFGDDGTGYNKYPKHLYADTGTYMVTLFVTNGCGNSDTASQEIYIQTNPDDTPFADIYFAFGDYWDNDTVTICTSEEIEIRNYSWDDNNLKFRWEMGDGTVYHTKNVFHSYSTSGLYEVKLIAINNCMGRDTAIKWVNVDTEALPNVGLAVLPDIICPGEKVYFIDEDNYITMTTYTYSIWFGDGDSLLNQTTYNEPYLPVISHVYSQTGTYSYVFTATNLCGNSKTNSGTVTVHTDPGQEAVYYIENSTESGSEYDIDRRGCPGDSVYFIIAGGMSYVWYFGDGASDTNQLPVHVYADTGSYDAYVVATNGCGRIDTVYTVVSISDTVKPEIWFDISDDFVCAGDTVRFFYPDYDYLSSSLTFFWDFGDSITSALKNPYHIYSSGSDYFVKLVITNGCGSDSLFRKVTVNNPKVEFYADQNGVSLSTPIYFINLTDGGSNFLWDFGDGTTSTQMNPVHTYNWYGIYDVSLSATSNSGCTTTLTKEDYIFIHNVTVAQAIVQDAKCPGENSGTIDIAVTGGIPPYQFLWNDGNTHQDRHNLSAGTYHLTITDQQEISISQTFTVNEPDEIIVEEYIENELCGNDGAIYLDITGGTPPYTILWSNGETAMELENLKGGVYFVTISDANNCDVDINVETQQYMISAMQDTLSLMALASAYAQCESADGIAHVDITGGSGNYFIAWDDELMQTNDTAYNLEAGIYIVFVSDIITGCWDSAFVAIQNIAGPTVNYFYGTPATCFDGNDGTAIVSASGTEPLAYEWSTEPIQTTSTATGLSAGTYFFTVTDDNGCLKAHYVIVNEPGETKIKFEYNNPYCFGDYTGNIHAILVNPMQNRTYTYLWSNGEYDSININRNAGTYTVTVTDNLGCSVTGSVTLVNPPKMQLNVFESDITFYTAEDGVIDITVINGHPPFNSIWSDGETTQDRIGLIAGTYSTTVTDAFNCTDFADITLTEPGPIDVTIQSGGPTTFCYGGSVVLDAGPGYLYYYWNTGETTQTIIADSNMTYYIVVVNDTSYGEDSMQVNVIKPYNGQELCLVTVDTTTGKNLIVWEKTEGLGIVSFNLYKETTFAGQYELLANIPFDSVTIFTDSASNPAQKSDRYKISVIDTCDNESPLSEPHKTMHLTVSTGIGVYNLIWENYEGFSFGSYYIYRGTTQYNLLPINAIQSTLTTYTDYQPIGLYYYQIAVVKGDTCLNTSLKAQGGPYAQSFSNLDDNGIDTTYIHEESLRLTGLSVYPNPFNDKTFIKFSNPNHSRYTLIITDVTGKTVFVKENITTEKIEFSRAGLSDGFYMIELFGERNLKGKLVIR